MKKINTTVFILIIATGIGMAQKNKLVVSAGPQLLIPTYAEINSAAGSGNNQYQYDDCSSASSEVFYRLKMTDIDGRSSYSSIVTIDGKSKFSLSIYPNPSKDLVLISSNDFSLINTMVCVTDASERLLIQAVINSLPHPLNIEKLPHGLYQLHFNNGETLKMIKEK